MKRCFINSVTQFCLVIVLAGSIYAQDKDDHQHKHSNALVKETSPYLLLHAHNPVNWYGWGEESLALAKKENKPIFLSIGYTSCHWCHVMERESFMDEEIAEFLNENFVCIKVDREERPDVDAIYMESLRVVNPRTNGGWPLSMFLTPDAKPFFGGTYFPARDGDRGVRFGFLTIVNRVHDAWKNQAEKIRNDSELVTGIVQKRLAGQTIDADAKIDVNWINQCFDNLKSSFDTEFGGFGFAPHDPRRPKFPEPSNLLFLIDQIQNDSAKKEEATKLFLTTCERMMMGGILDHLGGGFHRYSVDRFWKIPHFEKMLYDNAQLATIYSHAHKLTGREDFKMVVDELIQFSLREMKDKNGAFYSALDAESEGEEGKFYRWNKEEIQELLNKEEFELFAKVYGIDRAPNFEKEYYVPQLGVNFAESAKRLDMQVSELLTKLKPIRKKLFDARAKRPRPITDTKILASWNGMMIRGLADAGRLLENDSYTQAAQTAANFILNNMLDDQGRLYRTHTDGKPSLNAYLPDYACVIDGLLALHEATQDKKWLDQASKLQEIQDEMFWDSNSGGYFYTSADHEALLARSKRTNDGPVPAGNSVTAGNLIYFAQALNNPKLRDKASKTVLSASPLLNEFPIAAPRLLTHVRTLTKAKSE